MCNSTKQVTDYEALFDRILFADQLALQKLTGCLVPCTYQDYSLMGSSLPIKLPQNQLFILFVTTDILEDEEVFVFAIIIKKKNKLNQHEITKKRLGDS